MSKIETRPYTPAPSEEQEQKQEPQPHTGLHGFVETTGGKVVVTVTGILALGALAFGGFKAVEASSAPQHETSISDTPTPEASHTTETTPSATPEAEPSTAPEIDQPTVPEAMPENLKQYQEMTMDEFASVPRDEQLQYWAQIVGGPDGLRKFADDYYRISKDPRDKLPLTVSENNTPEEIIIITGYAERIPFSLTGDDQLKALVGGLHDGTGSTSWGKLSQAVEADPEGQVGGAVAFNGILPASTAISGAGVMSDGFGNLYEDITMKSDDGETFENRAFYVTTQYNGQPMSWWVIR